MGGTHCGAGARAMGLSLSPGRREGVEKSGVPGDRGGLCGAIPAPVPELSWGSGGEGGPVGCQHPPKMGVPALG